MRVGGREVQNNVWEWNNGVALDTSKFAQSQPDGSGTSLQMYQDGTWDDIDVVDTYEFCCERNISQACVTIGDAVLIMVFLFTITWYFQKSIPEQWKNRPAIY